ncbi:hypothetical protein SAMN03159463_05420 [Mesorhizobium sp. NFR06]|uniref:hypothetical protein n=1 Tax=Mesorhizobium sp. NFR06 TaxID=1566290 RepID=UPI0008E9A1BF|nr:hypothetical protein [Mesorhizobium sp. NFR06]SFQ03247.1 hypothetical protein SAMN03159463_05420 [Mesorhizobium sp. NFR06]
MTKTESKTASAALKDILLSDPDGLHEVTARQLENRWRFRSPRRPATDVNNAACRIGLTQP